MIQPTSNFLSLDFLRSFAGAVFVTNIIVHFIKDYLPQSLDKKITTLGVAICVVVINALLFESISAQSIYLAVINGFLVAAAATGNYEILTKQTKRGLILEQNRQKSEGQLSKIEEKKETEAL